MGEHFPLPMEHADIQKRIEAFLKELGIPSFIVFGWKKTNQNFGIVWSQHQMPPNVAIKGLTWALHDIVGKTLR
jgi:hypothetical protein